MVRARQADAYDGLLLLHCSLFFTSLQPDKNRSGSRERALTPFLPRDMTRSRVRIGATQRSCFLCQPQPTFSCQPTAIQSNMQGQGVRAISSRRVPFIHGWICICSAAVKEMLALQFLLQCLPFFLSLALNSSTMYYGKMRVALHCE